ncbi:MAG: SpoIIE family protein phosphatase [Spirochaeta sp.]|jgi:HAMP domain-containing protein|nr:SpoIIE family protein phosphatase [Spirochaeta sp.]
MNTVIRRFILKALFVALAIPAIAQQTEYFEPPRPIIGTQMQFPRLLTTEDRLIVVYQETERTEDGGNERGNLFVSLQWSREGRQWNSLPKRIGPIPYAGENPPFVFSATAGENGDLYIAVTESAERTVVYRSTDDGVNFSEVHEVRTARTNVAPRLFTTSTGGILLFVNQNIGGRQQAVYLYSESGDDWSVPEQLEPRSEIGLTFIPSHAAFGGRDYVVYQALNLTERSTYQLYIKISDDGGRTWSSGRRLTEFPDPGLSDDENLFDNQRPHLVADPSGDQLLLAWERRFQTGSPQIYRAGINASGELNGLIEEVTGRFELARSPRIAFDGDETVITWFTNPQGNSRVILGRREGFRWQAERMSPAVGEATFAEAVSFNGRLHIVWQRRAGEDGSEIVYLEPDQSVDSPDIRGGNFRLGERSARPGAEFVVVDPEDAAGIRAYSYVWSRNRDEPVPREIVQRVPDRTISVRAEEDGEWYLRVRATDFAGNWSEPTTASYYLDNTPPGPVAFPPPAVDENGFLVSNTFQVGWRPPEDEPELGGYTVRLDYIGTDPETAVQVVDPPAVPQRVTTQRQSTGGTNLDNGLWLLSVAAVDSVGNVGPTRSLPLRLDKYIPVTRIFATVVERDRLGRYSLEVNGRGFTSNGTVRQVVLDRDGSPPYDYEFNAWQNEFSVENDRRITGMRVDEVESATYRVGVLHSERGMYFAPERIGLNERGTIRYGDFRPVFAPVYRESESAVIGRSPQELAYFVTIAAALALILISGARLVAISREMGALGREARMLIQGEAVVTAAEQRLREERAKRMRIQWRGLRIKFMFFVVLLVVAVVVLVSVVLSRNVLERQERILVRGLQERIELLVEGQVAGARPALQNPQTNLDQLQNLANQGEAMTEALYVTITGLNAQGELQTVYATTDPGVIEAQGDRIDTETYSVGVSRLDDRISEQVDSLAAELNTSAINELGDIPVELEQLSQEAQQLIFQGAADEEIARIDEIRSELIRRAQERLSQIAGPIRSDPSFDFEQLRRDITTYLFYKPVMAIVPGAGAGFEDFYRGTIRVEISTQLILDEIDQTRRELIITTMVIAAAAVALGIFGAYILATIVVRPIRRLVDLVEEISATEDKASLKGRSLELRSRDELNQLATSINHMIEGLVKGAETSKDLLFGKETQKAFIPLERISEDAKRTYGMYEMEHASFFGYYEGAKGVSGDYFTYQKLDDRYVAMIKCDVAGKGIPAALIMVQVATVFQDYFRNWTLKSPGLDISSFVLRVNDIVAERQFKGRFAALTVGILDTHKGAFYTANAGDVKLHVYRTAQNGVEELTIPGGPAAGTFSSADMPLQFPQEMKTVAIGDLLLLFTDGLEEAKRLLRGKDWKTFVVDEEMITEGTVAEGLQVGEDGEEFSNERVHEIVTAAATRGRYQLTRLMNPAEEEELVFDFSTCTDPVRDTVLAVVAIERIFRMYPDPSAGPDDRVQVDRIVHDFLKEHFLQYNRYFGHYVDKSAENAAEGGENEAAPMRHANEEYLEFSHIKQDEQFDDITMLVVSRT